jgi:hypothetical protein
LYDEGADWRSARHLLEVYGCELLAIMENAIEGRARLVVQLVEYLPNLHATQPEVQESALTKLDSTWREIDRASTMLKEYIRSNFPLGNT